MDTPHPGDLRRQVEDAYLDFDEGSRLEGALGSIEFLRTTELIEPYLEAGATVADIGGGTGPYARWLLERGCRVVFRDLMPHHVEAFLSSLDERQRAHVDAARGDAVHLDLPDNAVAHTLLLGPLYHLVERAGRLAALREAARITRTGGIVAAAAISRWAPRLHGDLVDRLSERHPEVPAELARVEETGWLRPLRDGGFTAYCHRPRELRDEIEEAGLSVERLVSVEGLAFALSDLEERLADPTARAAVLAAARALGEVPELLGVGPHLLAICRVP